jgi:hypothetical protein
MHRGFAESGKILSFDQLTVPLTTGSITASQLPAKEIFYA